MKVEEKKKEEGKDEWMHNHERQLTEQVGECSNYFLNLGNQQNFSSQISFQLLENSKETREMAQQLRALAALPEGLVLIPSAHIAAHSRL